MNMENKSQTYDAINDAINNAINKIYRKKLK